MGSCYSFSSIRECIACTSKDDAEISKCGVLFVRSRRGATIKSGQILEEFAKRTGNVPRTYACVSGWDALDIGR